MKSKKKGQPLAEVVELRPREKAKEAKKPRRATKPAPPLET